MTQSILNFVLIAWLVILSYREWRRRQREVKAQNDFNEAVRESE